MRFQLTELSFSSIITLIAAPFAITSNMLNSFINSTASAIAIIKTITVMTTQIKGYRDHHQQERNDIAAPAAAAVAAAQLPSSSTYQQTQQECGCSLGGGCHCYQATTTSITTTTTTTTTTTPAANMRSCQDHRHCCQSKPSGSCVIRTNSPSTWKVSCWVETKYNDRPF